MRVLLLVVLLLTGCETIEQNAKITRSKYSELAACVHAVSFGSEEASYKALYQKWRNDGWE